MSEKLLIERLKSQAEEVYGPVREVILDAARALIDYETLKRAVNESTNECGPDCDEHHHGDNCPSLNSAQWLIDAQYALDSRDRTIRELTDELLKADNKLAAVEAECADLIAGKEYQAMQRTLAEVNAKLAEAERDIAEWKKLYHRRGEALQRPCIACGHKPSVIHANVAARGEP